MINIQGQIIESPGKRSSSFPTPINIENSEIEEIAIDLILNTNFINGTLPLSPTSVAVSFQNPSGLTLL